MPNISFDIFFNDDLVNITASRSQGAPKVKPGWKARSAPKIAQKSKPTPDSAFGPKAASFVSDALQNAPQYAENLQALGTALSQQQQANSAASAPKVAAQTAKTAASPAPKLGKANPKGPAAKAAASGISQDRGRSVTAKARGEAPPKLNGAPKTSAATKKLGSSFAINMAGAWVSGMVGNYVSKFVQPAVSSSGDFAGNALAGLGNGINGVGQSIEGSIRRYGDGAKDYGNAVKDWTNAPGTRVGTAGNPLGLGDSVSGGKNNLTKPRLQAPAPKKQEASAPKKSEPQRALPAAAPKKQPMANGVRRDAAAPSTTAKRSPVSSAPSAPRSSAPSTAPSKAGTDPGKKQNTARKDRRMKEERGDRDKKADAALKRLALANNKSK